MVAIIKQTHRVIESLFWPSLRLYYTLSLTARTRIVEQVQQAEEGNQAEIKVLVEGSLTVLNILRGEDVQSRAEKLFCEHRIWDTEKNSGILVYANYAERRIAVRYDRGIPNAELHIEALINESILRAKSYGDSHLLTEVLGHFLLALGEALRHSSLRLTRDMLNKNELSDEIG